MLQYRPFILLAILLPATSLRAGPPFVTDDPEPVEYQHWEVYLFSTYNHSSGSTVGQFPAVEVNYGVVPDVQLHLVAPVAFDKEGDSRSHYGFGDTELGIKYRFLHETDQLPQAGLFPLVEVPSGDSGRGLGSGQTQLFLPLWLQKSAGPWTTFFGGGYWFNPGTAHRNYFRLGWEVQRDLTEHLTLGGEIFHETPSTREQQFQNAPGPPGGMILPRVSSAPSDRGHTAFNLGGYYNFDDHRHLLFSFGRDLDGPTHFSFYLGFQLTF